VILYLDTSAVVKLYATEPGSVETEQLVTAARQVASSLIAYAETRAALARKYRMRQMNQKEFNARKDEFEHHWEGFFKLPVDAQLVRLAAEFAERFGLRAYDSIHLASADQLYRETRSPIWFTCFDSALNAAASKLGLKVAAG
jgi:predicted nucleic acid-binding protein